LFTKHERIVLKPGLRRIFAAVFYFARLKTIIPGPLFLVTPALGKPLMAPYFKQAQSLADLLLILFA
jgi:hypothetical protein